jgi:omega-hydroxy-beta-dihydromenaquinone-9 sulfotransferase
MRLRYKTSDFFNPTHTAIGIDLISWFQLLWKNKFAIDIRFLPKAFFLTVFTVLNAPFQLYEYLIYSKRIKRIKIKQPIFILGHPRSGTTYLQYVLSQDPRFTFCQTYEGLAPHVFLSSGEIVKSILNIFMPGTRPQDNVKAGASLPIEEEFALGSMSKTSWVHGLYFPKNIFNVFDECVVFQKEEAQKEHWKKHMLFFAQKLMYRNPDKILLLKSPCNTARIKEILEVFPDARFIHIHRNPYEVFLSNEGLYEKILPILGLHRVTNEFMQKYILYMYEALYKKYFLEKIALPEHQLCEIAYIDFISDPMTQLKKVYQQLEFGSFDDIADFLSKEVSQSDTYQKNTYATIDESIKAQINARWKFAFDAFGYTVENQK